MLRRSLLQLASRSSLSRLPLRATTQIPSYLSSRRAFSVSQKNGPKKLDPGSNVPEPQSRVPKILAGGLALGSVLLAAYYYGALDEYIGRQKESIREYTNAGIGDKATEAFPGQKGTYNQPSGFSTIISGSSSGQSGESSTLVDHAKQDTETHADSIKTEEDKSFQEKVATVQTPVNVDHVERRDIPSVPQSSFSSDDETGKPAEESFDLKGGGLGADEPQHKAIETTTTVTSAENTFPDTEIKSVQREPTTTDNIQEVVQGDILQKSDSLLGDYLLSDNSEEFASSSSNNHKDTSSTAEDARGGGYITNDGKLIIDFLQAIHAAEERQAEMDARSFTEEKRAMKEKYEKELKDARVRELMYAEREAILDKELTKERVKAAVALKSLQEKLEEQLKTELEQKEMEMEQRLKEMQDMAKAELAAAIASEKASQIEKMAEANLHINALCMAFYARSEEARQSHSAHKLALGALALEDALSKGLPIEKEVQTVRDHLEDIDKDSLIPLVLSSLPEDTKKYGTDTLSQLNHKFDAMKGTLRHFSLIPPGGGGILSHSLAQVASWLKVKEADESGEGVESLINRVDILLAQGKLCEAADILEKGVRGSQAAEVVTDWVRRARERAITEQALTVLQSYATSISLT
ncbi:MICOS complex subunit MIC60, mitochondrial-like isoform X1 [Salvia miltiorrhiza]|uniref:MICOS complex subunit MIC60, mitochondrial-like isoform X1 n=1 Tax=Salvia miltiorrhiza TaxID=226208 RepID=UPI0025ACDE59|nr:MICOS complex subunit MIC60, mitochondrial-like isoform X1 [Salvia miltiorrhiza]